MALETFKSQLKAKAKTLGVTNLQNKRIDAYAATLDKQNPDLATDDDHAEKVDAFLELVDIKQIAAYDDWQVSKGKKDGKPTDKKEPEKTEPEKKETDVDTPDDVPAWAKALIESNKALSETVNKFQSKETKQTMQARLKETLTDIPARFYAKWSLPEKEEDFDGFVENVKAEWEEFSKETGATNATSGDTKTTHKPNRGGGPQDGKATKEEVESIVNGIM